MEGIDYSRFGVSFAQERFPGISFYQRSAYDLSAYEENSFDIVTLLDVIEHVSNQDKVIDEVKRILKKGGLLVIATDIDDAPWKHPLLDKLIRFSQHFSYDGRAYRMIKKTEEHRKKWKNYHNSHIACLDRTEIKALLEKHAFSMVRYSVYPLVGVPVRDMFLQLLPKHYRGDHQCIIARK